MLISWIPSEASFQDASFLSEGILWALTSSSDSQFVQQNCKVNMRVDFRDEKTEIQRFEVIYVKVHNQEDPKSSTRVFQLLNAVFLFMSAIYARDSFALEVIY